ncbi:MAG: trypsin-like peptidase domain-containing protein [Oligoflexia bacterium]|nr:trypsin-like peptidase domain-containing protein [Oligoflexia bacterium]
MKISALVFVSLFLVSLFFSFLSLTSMTVIAAVGSDDSLSEVNSYESNFDQGGAASGGAALGQNAGNRIVMSMLSADVADSGINKVIYGIDNRTDVYASTNAKFKLWAQSTAAQISREKMVSGNAGTYLIKTGSLKEEMAANGMNFCSSERFISQPAAANCSGFLVGPDLLVTAGHCVQNLNECKQMLWVFDYKVKDAAHVNDKISVPTSSVYSCKELIGQALNNGDEEDFAFIRLDRAVTGRNPLSFRKSGTIGVNEQVVVIGHPSGLPTKITNGAFVRRSDHPAFFVANSDTYGGNSGSAVFNVRTGEVEGILVRGDQDFEYSSTDGCYVSKKCGEDECRGEDITKITVIKELMKMLYYKLIFFSKLSIKIQNKKYLCLKNLSIFFNKIYSYFISTKITIQ